MWADILGDGGTLFLELLLEDEDGVALVGYGLDCTVLVGDLELHFY